MGTICERQSQLHPQNVINDKILTSIKQEASKYRESCRWPNQLLKNINYIPRRELFQQIYIEQIKKFMKNNSCKHVFSSIHGSQQKIQLKKQIQASSLLQEQISAPLTIPTKKQLLQSQQSFSIQSQQNKSILMQMGLAFKTEFQSEIQYNICVKRFLKWMVLAQRHLKKKFLRFAYQSFQESIQKQIDRIKNQKLIYIMDSITFQTNKFISMMTLIYTQVYYLKQIQAQQYGNLFKNQNIYNFIMKMIFQTTSVSKNVSSIIKKKNSTKIQLFRQKLQLFDKQQIQFFQIPQQFLLIDGDTDTKSNDPNNIILYSQCIYKLRQIKQKTTPIGKLKIIICVSKLLKQLIEQFYMRKNCQLPAFQPQGITAVITYIIVKSKYENLILDLEIIQNFTSMNCMNCISGYYLSVFKASIQIIMTFK